MFFPIFDVLKKELQKVINIEFRFTFVEKSLGNNIVGEIIRAWSFVHEFDGVANIFEILTIDQYLVNHI